ncbi:MAG: sulfite exporter TauE/SafE family protein [bacterium]
MSPCCASTGLDPTEPVQGALLFGIGLAMSAGHCTGMCGPLVAAFGHARGRRPQTRTRFALDVGLYHGGRLAAYALLGAALAAVGTAARTVLPGLPLEAAVSLGAGLVLVVTAATVLATAAPDASGPAAAPARALLAAASRIGRPLQRLGPIGLGVANGFLPCGPVALVALGAASARDPWHGALSLVTFGLGTVPLLGVLTFGAGVWRARPRPALARVGSVFLFFLAAQLSLRGLAALGRVPHLEVGSWPLW